MTAKTQTQNNRYPAGNTPAIFCLIFSSIIFLLFINLSSVYADASPSPSPIEITNNNNNTNNNTNNNNINITSPVTVSASRKVSVGGGQATSSATTTKGGVEATSSATTKGGLKETPQTGAGAVAIAGLIGTGSLGVYMARYKKGQIIQEKIGENMGELGSIYVDLRSALKRNV